MNNEVTYPMKNFLNDLVALMNHHDVRIESNFKLASGATEVRTDGIVFSQAPIHFEGEVIRPHCDVVVNAAHLDIGCDAYIASLLKTDE